MDQFISPRHPPAQVNLHKFIGISKGRRAGIRHVAFFRNGTGAEICKSNKLINQLFEHVKLNERTRQAPSAR